MKIHGLAPTDLADLEARVHTQREHAVEDKDAEQYLILGRVLDLIAEARHLRAALNDTSVALLEQMGEFE